jgi:hypothetical protein
MRRLSLLFPKFKGTLLPKHAIDHRNEQPSGLPSEILKLSSISYQAIAKQGCDSLVVTQLPRWRLLTFFVFFLWSIIDEVVRDYHFFCL